MADDEVRMPVAANRKKKKTSKKKAAKKAAKKTPAKKADRSSGARLTKEQHLACYRNMVLSRTLDEKCALLLRQSKGGSFQIVGPGQEAAQSAASDGFPEKPLAEGTLRKDYISMLPALLR